MPENPFCLQIRQSPSNYALDRETGFLMKSVALLNRTLIVFSHSPSHSSDTPQYWRNTLQDNESSGSPSRRQPNGGISYSLHICCNLGTHDSFVPPPISLTTVQPARQMPTSCSGQSVNRRVYGNDSMLRLIFRSYCEDGLG